MNKNKKAQVFVTFLYFMTLAVFIFAYMQMSQKYTFWTKDGVEKKLGDIQFELIDKYAETEGHLFYLDQSLKYSMDLSIFYLAENGGYFSNTALTYFEMENSEESECGQYNGYQIWATSQKECYPDEYRENFELYFFSFFTEYVRQKEIFAQQDYENNFVLDYLEDEDFLSILGSSINPYSTDLIRIGQEIPIEADITIEPETVVSVVSAKGFIWPSSSKRLSSCFGWRILNGKKDYHDGIDISAVTGSPVYAVEDGVVHSVKTGCSVGAKSCGSGFGNFVVIAHNKNLFSAYHHMQAVNVKRGEMVKKGQTIGTSGNTGYSFGPHLDFKLYDSASAVHRKDAAKINPLCVYKNMGLGGKVCSC